MGGGERHGVNAGLWISRQALAHKFLTLLCNETFNPSDYALQIQCGVGHENKN
jgi:hypothetical protein